MIELIRKNRDYYWPALIIILVFSVISLILPKEESFLWINQWQGAFGINVFKRITLFGNSLIYIVLLIVCVFIKFRFSIIFLFTFILEGSITQILKKIVFHDIPRPLKHFELQGIDIQIAEGVKLYRHYSFPSGHSSTAFAVFTLISLLLLPPKYRWISVVFATLTAFSRVYLAQHFVPDIAAGSFIGLLTATFVYWWFMVYRPLFIENQKWIDKKLSI